MTAKVSSLHQNYNSEKKVDVVEKDIRKWVDSVVEFKANLEKQALPPNEKNSKRLKKYKIKNRPVMQKVQPPLKKSPSKVPRKSLKKSDKPKRKEPGTADAFDEIKESYKNLKLPQNWTSGISNNRLVFNRIKVTSLNTQQKVTVEKSLVITKDRNVHVLINGSEVALTNWEMHKVENVDDIKRAIKDIDTLKLIEGTPSKSPQSSTIIDEKLQGYPTIKPDMSTLPKPIHKKLRTSKKTGNKGISKQKSFQV